MNSGTNAVTCSTCGAHLGPADLEQPACRFCGTTHPHVATARKQVEALRQVMGLPNVPGLGPNRAPGPPGFGPPGFGAPPQQMPVFYGAPAILPPAPRSGSPVIFVVVGIAVALAFGILAGVFSALR